MKTALTRRHTFRILTASISAFLIAGTAQAQLSISDTGLTYTIDFDTDLAGVNNGQWLGTGFQPTPVVGQLDSDAWAATGWSDGAMAFGGTRTTGDFARGAFSTAQTTGGFYAMTGGSIGAGRALGIQPGGSDWAPGTLTLRIQNNSLSLITGFSLSYEAHTRNDQLRANSFNFSHSLNETTFISEPSLNLTSTEVGTGGAAFEQNDRSITLSGLSIPAGAFYYLRWSGADVGGSGSRDEFALDDIVFSSFVTGVIARIIDWNPQAGQGGSTWDTSTLNWLEAANVTAFGNGDTVHFTDAGLSQGGIVQVTAGVAPSGVHVQNTAGTYRFQDGSIGGSGGLTKSGSGDLVLEAANSFTGAVTLEGGTLEIADDNRLGAASNGVSFNGGTLLIPVNVNLQSGRSITGNAAIQVEAGAILTAAGATSTSALVLSGLGTVALNGTTRSVGAITFSNAATLASAAGAITATAVTSTHAAGTATISAPLDLGANATRLITVTDGTAEVDLAFQGALSLAGGSGSRLHKLGTGTLLLAGDNSGLAGSIRIGTAGNPSAAGGTVVISNKHSLGSTSTLQVQFNDGVLRATQPLTGANAIPLGLSIGAGQGVPATFAGQDMEFTGAVNFFRAGGENYKQAIRVENTTTFSGSFGLTSSGLSKGFDLTGPGTLVIAGSSNALDEPITVTDATLKVNGALTATITTITLEAGATLTGSGTIAGNVLAKTGSSLEPGNGLGTLTFGGDLDVSGILENDAGLKFELGPIASSDRVVLTAGKLTLGAEITFEDFDFTATLGFDGGTYVLFDTTQPITDFFSPLDGNIGGLESSIELSPDGTDIILNVVPEPASALLLLGGLGLVTARRRR